MLTEKCHTSQQFVAKKDSVFVAPHCRSHTSGHEQLQNVVANLKMFVQPLQHFVTVVY